MATQQVSEGKVVTIHYTLKNDAGNVVDSSSGAEPLAYLHGSGNIIPGLESQMEGKSQGDRFTAVIPPAHGYGERNGPGPQPVPRSAFPEGADPQPGMQFAAQGPDGSVMQLWVTEVKGDEILLDAEHPLAGQTLHFDIEVVEVRDATAEERTHGHVHGAHGHHH